MPPIPGINQRQKEKLTNIDEDTIPNWYYIQSPREIHGAVGPHNIRDLKELFLKGKIHNQTLVWKGDQHESNDWQELSSHPNLYKKLIALPPIPSKEEGNEGSLSFTNNIQMRNRFPELASKYNDSIKQSTSSVKFTATTKCTASWSCTHCGNLAIEYNSYIGDQFPDIAGLKSIIGSVSNASEVIPGFLWIGNSATGKIKIFEQLNLSLIIICANETKPIDSNPPVYRCMKIPLVENPTYTNIPKDYNESMQQYFEYIYDLIELERTAFDRIEETYPKPEVWRGPTDEFGEPIKKKSIYDLSSPPKKRPTPRVLLFSRLGTDRPCTLLAAYLIRKWGVSLDRALAMIREEKPQLKLSDFHIDQLKIWSQKHSLGAMYCLDCIKEKQHLSAIKKKFVANSQVLNAFFEEEEESTSTSEDGLTTARIIQDETYSFSRYSGSTNILYKPNQIQQLETILSRLKSTKLLSSSKLLNDEKTSDIFQILGDPSDFLIPIHIPSSNGNSSSGSAGSGTSNGNQTEAVTVTSHGTLVETTATSSDFLRNLPEASLQVFDLNVAGKIKFATKAALSPDSLSKVSVPFLSTLSKSSLVVSDESSDKCNDNTSTSNTNPFIFLFDTLHTIQCLHQLQSINLSNNQLSSNVICHIMKCLQQVNRNVASHSTSSIGGGDMALTALDLSHNRIGIEGATAIGEFLRETSSLIYLDISSSQLGDDAGAIIIRSLEMGREFEEDIEPTVVGSMATSRVGIESSSDNLINELKYNHTLTDLRISNNQLYIASVAALVHILKTNNTLSALYLDVNEDFGVQEMKTILSTIRSYNSSIQYLSFDDITMTVVTTNQLFQILSRHEVPLCYISLSRCKLNPKHLKKLPEFITSISYLKYLNLSGNNLLGDDGMDYVAKILSGTVGVSGLTSRPPLVRLDLNDCGITSAGAEELIEAIAVAKTLQFLDLSHNKLGSDLAHFASYLKQCQLKDLVMNRCHTGTKGAAHIFRSLETTNVGSCGYTLKTLYLAENNIQDSIEAALRPFLESNLVIQHLDLGYNKLSDVFGKKIKSVLEVTTKSCTAKKVLELNVNLIGNNCDPYALDMPGAARSKLTYRYMSRSGSGCIMGNDARSTVERLSGITADTKDSAALMKGIECQFRQGDSLRPFNHIS